jgi:1-deoxy-D-xylulose-5-phosphate reductoisomerase
VLNAAGECAVAAFLEGSLPFLGIPAVLEDCLEHVQAGPVGSIGDALEADRLARAHAAEVLKRFR